MNSILSFLFYVISGRMVVVSFKLILRTSPLALDRGPSPKANGNEVVFLCRATSLPRDVTDEKGYCKLHHFAQNLRKTMPRLKFFDTLTKRHDLGQKPRSRSLYLHKLLQPTFFRFSKTNISFDLICCYSVSFIASSITIATMLD